MSNDTISVSIITSCGVIASCQASAAILPGENGELGVLPKHALLISSLSTGVIRIIVNNDVTRYFVDTGIMQVANAMVNIVADFAINLEIIEKAIIVEKINYYKLELEKSYDQDHKNLLDQNLLRYQNILRYK